MYGLVSKVQKIGRVRRCFVSFLDGECPHKINEVGVF
jgi:hypothetical protein